MAPLKRAALRVLRLYTHGQVQFNRAVLGVIDRWDAHLRELHGHLAAGLARSETRLTALEEDSVRRAELDERVYPLQIRTEDLETDLQELEETLAAHVATESVFARDSYFAFENQFRGAREEDLRRHQFYIPFLQDAATRGGGNARFLDLGCGRGELLELAAGAGLAMTGWDADPAMVLHCRSLGLDANPGDLFDALRSAEDGSLAGVTALQVIEHLPFPRIRQLLELAHRKLRPGGLLAVETIDPASWYAMRFFYADPTTGSPCRTARASSSWRCQDSAKSRSSSCSRYRRRSRAG